MCCSAADVQTSRLSTTTYPVASCSTLCTHQAPRMDGCRPQLLDGNSNLLVRGVSHCMRNQLLVHCSVSPPAAAAWQARQAALCVPPFPSLRPPLSCPPPSCSMLLASMAATQLSRHCMHPATSLCRCTYWLGSRRAGLSCCCLAAQQQQYTAASQHKQAPRFYCPQLPHAAGVSVELDPEEAKHAVRVLRLQTGWYVHVWSVCSCGQAAVPRCPAT